MGFKSAKPENGKCPWRGTKAKSAAGNPKPVGTENKGQKPSIAQTHSCIKRSLHGLVINLVPTTNDVKKWDESVLGEVLLKDNILEDLLKKYIEQIASGSIQVGFDGKVSGKHAFKKSHSTVVLGVAGSALGNRLIENPQVKQLVDDASAMAKAYGRELKAMFFSGDFSKICFVIGVGAVAGGVVVGFVSAVEETESDIVAGAAAGLVNLIPETFYEAGTAELKFKTGKTEVEWKPSKGTWKVGGFAGVKWQPTKKFKVSSKLELLIGDKGFDVAGNVKATYDLNQIYLNSVALGTSALPGGNYQIKLQLNKTVSSVKDSQIDLFIGAQYTGRYRGDAREDDNHGFAAIGGIKVRFKGPGD